MDIRINYFSACVDIDVMSAKGNLETLKFEDLVEFSLSHRIPWGIGSYVCASTVTLIEDNYQVEIELNSGDCIHIIAGGK